MSAELKITIQEVVDLRMALNNAERRIVRCSSSTSTSCSKKELVMELSC
jgi:hypothetical protein